jgi:hypothetical protein
VATCRAILNFKLLSISNVGFDVVRLIVEITDGFFRIEFGFVGAFLQLETSFVRVFGLVFVCAFMGNIGVRRGVSKGVEHGCRLPVLRAGHPRGVEG